MDILDAVIGLGPNLFYGTELAVCILVFRLKKPKDHRKKVLIVDASKEFKKGRAQNELLPEHVDRIYQWYTGHKDVAGVARLVSLDEIQQNDWNLNIPRYVEPIVEAETLTVADALVNLQTSLQAAYEAEGKLSALLKKGGAAEMTTSEDQAQTSLSKLVEHVFNHRDGLIQPLYYSQLAERIGRLNKHGDGHEHGMGNVLGKMGHLLIDIEGEWGEGIPHIQSLVVNKNGILKDLPDEGIKEFWPDYPAMSYVEKTNRTRIEHQRIVDFGSRWNDVLKRLGLPEITASSQTSRSKSFFGKGGESESHKRLKGFIRDNPELVGAQRDWQAILEYPLPSLDEIDVVFKSADACVAVEVKSTISDLFPADYERGLFQIVKYGALLEAMARSGQYGIPPKIKTILVLLTVAQRRSNFCQIKLGYGSGRFHP
jgi:hypothetical protein